MNSPLEIGRAFQVGPFPAYAGPHHHLGDFMAGAGGWEPILLHRRLGLGSRQTPGSRLLNSSSPRPTPTIARQPARRPGPYPKLHRHPVLFILGWRKLGPLLCRGLDSARTAQLERICGRLAVLVFMSGESGLAFARRGTVTSNRFRRAPSGDVSAQTCSESVTRCVSPCSSRRSAMCMRGCQSSGIVCLAGRPCLSRFPLDGASICSRACPRPPSFVLGHWCSFTAAVEARPPEPADTGPAPFQRKRFPD